MERFILLAVCLIAAPVAAAPASVVGNWLPAAPMPEAMPHAHMLPTWKVMLWPGDGVAISGNDPRAWDYVAKKITALKKPGYNIFCSGHVFMGDGKLFVAGGHIQNGEGLARAGKYNPFTNTWQSLPSMNDGRWYPTATALANGDILVTSGTTDTTFTLNTLPQVFQAATGTWRNLTSAQREQELYPTMFLAPNGKVFDAGPQAATSYLRTSGTGGWSFVANRVGGYRSHGGAVMYAPGQVLAMGGGDPPLSTAEVIDLNAASPSWRAVGSLRFARRQLNATILPDGKVLATGGTSAPGFSDADGHVDAAELWDPVTRKWTTLASSSGIPRVYHSTALLLPDGRVLSTGGDYYPETEVFSPPYLFKGARPAIQSAPAYAAYGKYFVITTKSQVSKVTVIRLSSTTHTFNMSQNFNRLVFSKVKGGVKVRAPLNGNLAAPGYYMLFILNKAGVPSLARRIRLGK